MMLVKAESANHVSDNDSLRVFGIACGYIIVFKKFEFVFFKLLFFCIFKSFW
jgi:hypothetical protein